MGDPVTTQMKRLIDKNEEGTYFEIPFNVPEGTARIDIRYSYLRHRETFADNGDVVLEEINIVDLGLRAPFGFVGASGSDRSHVWVSAASASAGYAAATVVPGLWHIIVGAYKVADEGVEASYHVTCTPKAVQLLRGDMHMHTTASDGHLTPVQLMAEAVRLGLDFVCLTDHNAFAQNDAIAVAPEGLTVIPGMELTHYKGHCGLLGARRPIDSPFCINTWEEMAGRLDEARKSGALIAVNHPHSAHPWAWGLERTPFDLLEIWNGGTPPVENRKCIDWWHGQLMAGRRIAIIGGSDFHATDAFRSLACPTTWAYAASNDAQDILTALRNGQAFVTMSHHGPTMSVACDGIGLGGVAVAGTDAEVVFYGLSAGDEVRVIDERTTDVHIVAHHTAEYALRIPTTGRRFLRFEVMYAAHSPFAGLPRLISNPVYFVCREETCVCVQNREEA